VRDKGCRSCAFVTHNGDVRAIELSVMNGSIEAALVSVVITCYNQARFLGDAIDSVLRQSYTHFEIIIVDDGSQDDPARIASVYENLCFIRQHNQGVSAARNAGLIQCRGKYVVFLDADDRLLPKALETGVLAHESHPSAGFVYGQYRSIDFDGAPSRTPEQVPVNDRHYAELLCRNYIGLPGMVMHRRDVLESLGGWDRTADHAGDWELYLRVTKKYPIFCHHHPVVEYRQHGANTSQNHALMLTNVLSVLRSQRPYVKGNKELQAAYRKGVKAIQGAYGEAVFEQMRSQMRAGRGQWRGAWRNMIIVLRLYPQGLVRHALRKVALFRGARQTIGDSQ
jgi:glycosyltransferase involved in cell wall biosynthesis